MFYTQEQKGRALELFDETQSITKVIQVLGYPSRQGMYTWIGIRNGPKKEKAPRKRWNNTPRHPQHPAVNLKMEVLHRCFELGENVQLVSEETGYSRASIYGWHKKYVRKGIAALMNAHDDSRGKMKVGKAISSKEVEKLKAQIQDMQLEIDILKETMNVIKKDPGADLTAIKNREKAVIIDALKPQYPLPTLLYRMQMARSSYYYQLQKTVCSVKKEFLKEQIKMIYAERPGVYGYRRIHALLKRMGICVSEKIVRRIMHMEGLTVKTKRKNKYSSYKGEITPAVPNILNRDFHAEAPNQKWLTDITEFALPEGKVYLSPIVDCFDGMLPAWKIGIVPDAGLVNGMLKEAIATLRENEHPIVHTDRGCHYRWPGWIGLMKEAGLQRSMSKKGCSPDNSACEGLFGRLKNEMFYTQSWANVSIKRFIEILNQYLIWYNRERIKVSLGNRSPEEYRRNLGLIA